MPAPDTFELLRRLDPAADLAPAEPEARERLRRSIVATPVRQEPRKTQRSRGRVVLIVAVLALVLTAAGWGLRGSFLNTAETARGEFERPPPMIAASARRHLERPAPRRTASTGKARG